MKRYSSLRNNLFSEFLAQKLQGAKSYDRIAGYFSSSILEIAGEAIEKMEGKVRIICNSDLSVEDVRTAKLAAESLRQEWCDFQPERLPPNGERFRRLYDFLKSGKLEVRILPKDKFGLEHGKAGVFTLADGSRTSFLGSINESYNGWKINYELVWEDDTPEAVAWVQEEFDQLWNNQYAVKLCDFVIQDIKRIADREEVSIEEWRQRGAEPSSAIVEANINRKSFGLWEHQKAFIKKVFDDHRTSYGAHYVLADEVGLGKTAQLAMAAELMALTGTKPILVIVPKTLLYQWQSELIELLGIPSAIWDTGRHGWVDERGVYYGVVPEKCPRRIGIVSQGIINNGSEASQKFREALLGMKYECIIVDEAHHARRKNLSERKLGQKPQMNNLYKFLMELSPKAHSVLLATATPVQLFKVEAYDLLNILSVGNACVLGTLGSCWRKDVLRGLDLTTGDETIDDISEAWSWMRNPLPTKEANLQLMAIRNALSSQMADDVFNCETVYSEFPRHTQNRIGRLKNDGDFFRNLNPYILHIVCRKRSFLENTINRETGQPYLPKINVMLFGEKKANSLVLDGSLKLAYEAAEEFCESLQSRCASAGLFKTLLLRRIGSSMIAGYNTGKMMQENWHTFCGAQDMDEDDEEVLASDELKDLTPKETRILQQFVDYLNIANISKSVEPKYKKTKSILEDGVIMEDGVKTEPWKNRGCIIFSHYFDTVDWLAKNLSEDIDQPVGVYAGGAKSGIYNNGIWRNISRDEIKAMVRGHALKILVGTDAASEGLNLQTLGALINFDLPWNPTRLEQRKGRIQRIGQAYDDIYIYNLRYRDSVEDRVHELLSARMENIYKMFGQLPDVLEDVWVDVALGQMEEAKKRIDELPVQHPFTLKYQNNISTVDWESCATVLNKSDILKTMMGQW